MLLIENLVFEAELNKILVIRAEVIVKVWDSGYYSYSDWESGYCIWNGWEYGY